MIVALLIDAHSGGLIGQWHFSSLPMEGETFSLTGFDSLHYKVVSVSPVEDEQGIAGAEVAAGRPVLRVQQVG